MQASPGRRDRSTKHPNVATKNTPTSRTACVSNRRANPPSRTAPSVARRMVPRQNAVTSWVDRDGADAPRLAVVDDRLYFRQLLSGRDFASNDQVAAQMVNFVYAIGDRATGECLLVDPAYSVGELVE